MVQNSNFEGALADILSMLSWPFPTGLRPYLPQLAPDLVVTSVIEKTASQVKAPYGAIDESLAIDGKTMRNAIDDSGRQIHIMGSVGHQSKQNYTPKKSAPCQ